MRRHARPDFDLSMIYLSYVTAKLPVARLHLAGAATDKEASVQAAIGFSA